MTLTKGSYSMSLFTRVKLSREEQVIKLMQRPEGAYNYELNRVMFRYGATIHSLRKDGYAITTELISRGLFKYRMETK